jgi:hypothetical protein
MGDRPVQKEGEGLTPGTRCTTIMSLIPTSLVEEEISDITQNLAFLVAADLDQMQKQRKDPEVLNLSLIEHVRLELISKILPRLRSQRMKQRIFKTLDISVAVLIAASALVSCASPAVAQSKNTPPPPAQTGAQYCEFSKGHVESLRSMLKTNASSWSVAMRASVERDLVASEKEATACCADLDQCKRTFEAPAKKSTAK